MLELVNISNTSWDIENILENDMTRLKQMLQRHNIAGLELMLYEKYDNINPPLDLIKGVHLRFWQNWLDFWRGDKNTLLEEFGTEKAIRESFGSSIDEWLELYRDNFLDAGKTGAEYVVFHVSFVRSRDIYGREFSYTDEEVVGETIAFLNMILRGQTLPSTCKLLFENLWWPGIADLKPESVERLLSEVKHDNVGIMLDTGHLMNTNLNIKNEAEAVEYVLQKVDRLGSMADYIKGIHLHKSLSGDYVKKHLKEGKKGKLDIVSVMEYIVNVDQHNPFEGKDVKRIVDRIRPEYLVHEFIQKDFADWEKKICTQRHALGFEYNLK